MTFTPPNFPVSLITTVYNEADNIEALLNSLLAQTRPPTEIVVVDGGSTDNTLAILETFAQKSPIPLQVIRRPGANISQGRNAAIQAARYTIIAATDAGVRLPTDWLEQLIAPFGDSPPPENSEFSPETQVVAGFFRADPDLASPFQIAMGATVLPAPDDIQPEKFLPSSRSIAFTKTAWQAAGGYPEWLDYCEDLIFDLNLKKKGYSFYWQPKAVAMFAPRTSLGAFFRQYYRYARGDGKAALFLKRHLLRYLTYGLFAPLGLFLGWRNPRLLPLIVAIGVGYIWKPYHRLFFYLHEFSGLSAGGKLAAMAWIPVIRATGDIAKMVGYPVGRRWRQAHRSDLP